MPTPTPTNEEFLEDLLSVDQRESAAWNEILRRLRTELPDKIAFLNTRLADNTPGYALAGKGIQAPEDYYVAPQILTDDYLNTVLVKLDVDTLSQAPGTFHNQIEVVVYSIDGRFEVKEQVVDAYDRSGAIRGLLRHYLNGCEDLEGRTVWRHLRPTGKRSLPQEWAQQYSGVACHFLMIQSPDEDNWT